MNLRRSILHLKNLTIWFKQWKKLYKAAEDLDWFRTISGFKGLQTFNLTKNFSKKNFKFQKFEKKKLRSLQLNN